MKRLLSFLFIFTILFTAVNYPLTVSAKVTKAPKITTNDLIGRLVLQKDSDYKLWYVNPVNKERWYLHNDYDLELLIKKIGVTPLTSEFYQLATHIEDKTPKNLLTKYAGKIIISPIDSSQTFFLNKADGLMYDIGDFDYFYYKIGKIIGISVNDSLLRSLPMNSVQETYDPTFYGIAYAKFDGLKIINSNVNSQRVLPLASLTKVMTALIFLDNNPDWDKIVTITPEEIKYPCTLQLCGTTSEISLKAGDQVRIYDLWVAMLAASSNQSAYILANHSGLSTEEFVNQMNEKAKSLGLKKTKFVEMSGLSADNVSTAEEFTKIAKAAFADGRIADATASSNYIFNVTQADGLVRQVSVNNRNYSLLAMGPKASKSGYLVEAQRNAVIEKNGHIIVALHCYSLNQRNSVISNLLKS